jgi:hypothetical protein
MAGKAKLKACVAVLPVTSFEFEIIFLYVTQLQTTLQTRRTDVAFIRLGPDQLNPY